MWHIDLDLSIGDIHAQMVDIEVEAILNIQRDIVDIESSILAFAERCSELDW